MSYICAIDQGTSSSRAIIFDKDLNICASAQKEINAFYPNPGWVEQDPEEILNSVIEVVKICLDKAKLSASDLSAFAISNQRETTIVWDKTTGKAVYPAIVWQSRQSSFYCDDLKQKGFEPFVKKKTGLVIDSYFSASKIRFILDEIENGQARADNGELMFGTVDTWLVYHLSNGKYFVSDVTNASRTLLMNIEKCKWDDKLLNIWNIPSNMCAKIVDTAGDIAVCDKKWFGSDVPIAAIVGDQQSALFGQLCLSAGDVKNTYGTGCFILMNTGDQRIESKNGLLTTIAWRKNGQINYALEGSVFVAGAAIQWLRDGLHLIQQSTECEKVALKVESSEGVVVVPAFAGLGAPYWQSDVQGAIFGLTRGITDAHVVRATIESLALQTYDVVQAMQEDSLIKLTKLQVDGGASLNNYLMEYQAGILGVDVVRPLISETTALGACMLAGLAVGMFKNEEELIQKWKSERCFKPTMSKSKQIEILELWKRAIKAVLSFKEH
jgi:glycerol kinase